MSSQLPAAIARKVEQTLAQWRHWQGDSPLPGAPHICEHLEGGASNHSVLAEAAGEQFIIRIDGINPARNGLNRQVEWSALKQAHQAGIGPRPRYFNPDIGALVCDYLPADEQQTLDTDSVAALLRAIHSLAPLHFKMDPLERMQRYERQLEKTDSAWTREIVALAPRMHILARESALQGQPCLCHHDLNRSNLLRSGGRLYALDWEYSAMGNPLFDLTVVLDDTGLDSHQLMASYLGREPTSTDWQSLQTQQDVARYLELLWYATGQDEARAGVDIGALLQRLKLRFGPNP